MNPKIRFCRLLLMGSLVFAGEAFAANAQFPGSGSAITETPPPGSVSAPAPDTLPGGTGVSSKSIPQSGANNDPALQEPKAGPTGAPGVATESGSPDANGMRSNAKAPLPTP